MNFRAFLTGSHAYGIPHNGSDVDLVVFVTVAELEMLRSHADGGKIDHEEEYIAAGGMPLRFSNLNLICVTSEKQYEIWWKGTRKLKTKAPVTRDFACKFLRRLREDAGYSVPRPLKLPKRKNTEDIPF